MQTVKRWWGRGLEGGALLMCVSVSATSLSVSLQGRPGRSGALISGPEPVRPADGAQGVTEHGKPDRETTATSLSTACVIRPACTPTARKGKGDEKKKGEREKKNVLV